MSIVKTHFADDETIAYIAELESQLAAALKVIKDARNQEPVATVVSSGEFNFPLLQWKSANHSLEVPIGSDLYAAPVMPVQEGWISIENRLPAWGQPVALINIDRYENSFQRNIYDAGYLAGPEFDAPSLSNWWNIRGKHAYELHAYTHWLALPPVMPKGGE